MANPPKFMISLTLLVLFFASHQGQGIRSEMAGGEQKQGSRRSSSSEEYAPVQSVVYRSVWTAETPCRPFQVCSGPCRCCAPSNSSNCVDTAQCCFGVMCNLPGKPFGTCAFSPVSCDCRTCTQPSSSHPSSSSLLHF